MTLVEVLTVVVLLGLVVGLVAAPLAAPTARAREQAAIATIHDLDARARLLAQTDGHASLSIVPDPWRIELARASDVVSTLALDPAWELRVRAEGRRTRVDFDSRGRSPSYTLEWIENGTRREQRVCGSTGWFEEAP